MLTMALRMGLIGGATVAVLASGDGAAQSRAGPGECPQPRFTGKAPDEYYRLKNPLTTSEDELGAGKRIYEGKAGRANCALCHGIKGNGKGPLASLYDPPPRNFACAQTINGIPDGQLFWIIKFGSPGTGMPPNPQLVDRQVWQLVLFLRQLSR